MGEPVSQSEVGLSKLPFPSVARVQQAELEILDDRSQHVIRKRGEGVKLSALANELGLPIDRVRQMERSALIEIRNHREQEEPRRSG